jgi:ParB-like chromosome segregation protein Spo0J
VDADKYERGSLYKFDPDEILVEPGENGRHEEPVIEWLIADMHERGQGTPVTVRSDGGKPVLVFGYQRLRAIKAINERWPNEPMRKVACIFKQLTKEEAFRANIAENRMRNETTPIDDAHNIKRLMNVYGYNDEMVVAAYFPALIPANHPVNSKEYEDARRWVRERMALIGLTPKAEKAVRDGRVKLHSAIKLNKLPAAKQDELVAGGKWVKAKDVAKASNAPAPKPRVKAATLEQTSDARGRVATAQRWAVQGRNSSPLFDAARDLLTALEDAVDSNRILKGMPSQLVALFDTLSDSAVEASLSFSFDGDVLEAIEAWRKARVK